MPQGIGNLTQSLSPVKIYPGSGGTENHQNLTGALGCVENAGPTRGRSYPTPVLIADPLPH